MGGSASAEEDGKVDSVVGNRNVHHMQRIDSVILRLGNVIIRAYEARDEEVVPLKGLTEVMHMMKDHLAKLRENPRHISEELAKEPGCSMPTAEQMQALATWVYYAHLVADVTDTDTIRDTLRQANCELVCHSTEVDHTRAPYFMCFNTRTKQVVLAIRGLVQLDDVLTDIVAEVMPLEHIETEHGAPTPKVKPASAHKGFAKAAQAIVNEVHVVLQTLMVSQGYSVVVVGHSLGAGVACCVAKLLFELALPVTCFTYGAPPCVDREAALSMASYCTSVVYNDDVIARASLSNFRFVGELARSCAEAASAGGQPTAEAVLELAAALEASPAVKVAAEQDLFVPGKVVFLYLEDCSTSVTVGNGMLRTLRRLELSKNCLGDHLCEAYIAATQDVASRLGKRSSAVSVDYRPWTVQAVFDSGSGSDSSDREGSEASTVAEDEEG